MGSYLAILHLDGFADARLPFMIDRSEHERLRVDLLTPEQVGDGFAYVPAGPAILGGDPDALASFLLAQPEVAGFCMQVREVTFGEYFEFVRDVERSNPEEAQRRAPRGPLRSSAHEPFWKLDDEDRIQPALPLDFDESYPAFGISWWDAKAYCAWLTARAGEPGVTFDLPTEVEWEKAARGADGRLFTWGNTLEWTFARLAPSSKTAGPLPVGLYPTDESVYGIRDLGGNVREWCSGQASSPGRRMRGGSWGSSVAGNCHAACRVDEKEPEFVDLGTGCRVVKRFE
jgi:serine/threonine-protein kinase